MDIVGFSVKDRWAGNCWATGLSDRTGVPLLIGWPEVYRHVSDRRVAKPRRGGLCTDRCRGGRGIDRPYAVPLPARCPDLQKRSRQDAGARRDSFGSRHEGRIFLRGRLTCIRAPWITCRRSERSIWRSRKDEPLLILDLGSLDVNGSYREHFAVGPWTYRGLDAAAGKNVDIVLRDPYDWRKIRSDSADVVISGQAFEHVEFFWLTMLEIARVLKPEGLVAV